MLLVIAIVVGLVTLVGTQIASGFPDLEKQASSGLTEVQHWLATGPLHITTDQLAGYVGRLQSLARARTPARWSAAPSRRPARSATSWPAIFIALFSTYFMLAQGDVIWGWILKVLPDAAQEPMDVAGRRGWVTLTSYIRATVLVAATDALGIGIGAAILGVPLAVPLGVLVFLGAFIPVVGALVSGIVAVLVALVSHGVGHRADHARHRDGGAAGGSPCAATVPDGSRGPGAPARRHPRASPPVPSRRASSGALFAVPIIAVGNTIGSSLAGRIADDDDRFASDENPVGDDVAPDPDGAADATCAAQRRRERR